MRPETPASQNKLEVGGVFLTVLCCFPDEQVEVGELDLNGIDDQEIEKVTGLSGVFWVHLPVRAFIVKGCVISLTLNVSSYSTSSTTRR